jgi:hypothetical protein
MALNRFRDSSSAFRLLMAVGIAFLLSVALLVSNLDGRRNNFPDIPQYSPLPTVVRESVYTPRSEIVSRLEKILEIRETAYRFRNPEMLRGVYSEDCPCLANDERGLRN